MLRGGTRARAPAARAARAWPTKSADVSLTIGEDLLDEPGRNQNILGGVLAPALEEGDAVSMHTSQSKSAWNKLVGTP